jgi:hypothetical protein
MEITLPRCLYKSSSVVCGFVSFNSGRRGAEAIRGEGPGRGLRGLEFDVELLGEPLPRLGSRLLFAGQARLGFLRRVSVLVSSISIFYAYISR